MNRISIDQQVLALSKEFVADGEINGFITGVLLSSSDLSVAKKVLETFMRAAGKEDFSVEIFEADQLAASIKDLKEIVYE